jgi:hypothetical protein
MRVTPVLLILAAMARPALAQTEEELRAYFEGKNVVIKIDMPGAEAGVDVHPGTAQPIVFPDLAKRLKLFGTSIHRGDQALVTKVKVKKDIIEFQLGGGGYGTFGDDASPNVNVPAVPKSAREKELERDLDRASDPDQKRRIRNELDRLKSQRQREDARNQARAAEARQIKAANIRQRRAEGGSRFNLRYKSGVPADALTPDGVMQALAQYVDFSGESVAVEPPPPMEAPRDELRKGLTVEEVDQLLGRPESITRRREGTLEVSTSTYYARGRTIRAEFVEDVLIRFTISSRR